MKISLYHGKLWIYFSDGHEYHLAELIIPHPEHPLISLIWQMAEKISGLT
jgi:hypothetical protein